MGSNTLQTASRHSNSKVRLTKGQSLQVRRNRQQRNLLPALQVRLSLALGLPFELFTHSWKIPLPKRLPPRATLQILPATLLQMAPLEVRRRPLRLSPPMFPKPSVKAHWHTPTLPPMIFPPNRPRRLQRLLKLRPCLLHPQPSPHPSITEVLPILDSRNS